MKPIKYVVCRVTEGKREYLSSDHSCPWVAFVKHAARYRRPSVARLEEGEFLVPLLPSALARRPTRAWLGRCVTALGQDSVDMRKERDALAARVRELEERVASLTGSRDAEAR